MIAETALRGSDARPNSGLGVLLARSFRLGERPPLGTIRPAVQDDTGCPTG